MSRELHDAADDLNARWALLDARRFTSRAVGSLANERSTYPHLAEYQSLQLLEDASVDRAKRPSLTRTALAQLDAAYLQATETGQSATCRVAGRRLAECLRAYRTLPRGSVPLSRLTASAKAAWNAIQAVGDDQHPGRTLHLRSALGEFFKEAYTSRAIRDELDASEFEISEQEPEIEQVLLLRAQEVLGPAKDLLTSGTLLESSDLIAAATAVRHLAVIHEYYYFRPDSPHSQRAKHLHEWLRLSVDAVAVCVDQKEFSTRAYALLNKAAASAEIAAFDPTKKQLAMLEESAADVRSAQDLFALADDDRGITWAGIHLTRILTRQYEIGQRDSGGDELEYVLHRMLETAIDAEANSKRVDDEVAQGLAALYLSAAESEALRLGVSGLSTAGEPEIADRARQAATVLSATHRLPQAARALQIAAQCELGVAAATGTNDRVRASSHRRAMNDLTRAIATLTDNGDLDAKEAERIVQKLHDSVAACVPRWTF